MSFSGTPLGQGRRLDHSTFLGKPTSNGSKSLPSYAYGAPALGSRSPPKPTSPSRDRNRTQERENEAAEDDPALIRFARLKQRESAAELTSRPGGPKVIQSPPKPEKWSVKDTSVNIATAFNQAVSGDMSSTHNHNNSWASSSRSSVPVPRSTSVEYEASAPAAAHRRLAPPPDKLGRGPSRKPVSKSASSRHVPDSEGEENATGRGKSPFEHGFNIAKQALNTAAFYVRQRSHEPENTSGAQPTPANGHVDGNESSYSYTQEEASFQAAQKRNLAGNKKARMSADNKAYRPSQSDEEESDYSDDGQKKRGKKSRKGPVGGPLTTLPVVSGSKRRKGRKGQGAKGDPGDPEDDHDSDGAGETDILSQTTQMQAPASRASNPPLSRASASRLSHESAEYLLDDSISSANQGLDSIPEIAEELLDVSMEPPIRQSSQQRRARSRTPAPTSQPPSFSIGGLLGSIVHVVIRLGLSIFSGIASIMSMFTFLFGQVFGTTFDIILRRPAGWARGASSLLKYLMPAMTILLAWYILQSASLGSYIPSLSFPTRSPNPIYRPPDVPPADLSEFSEWIQRIEKALTALSADAEKTKAKLEDGKKSYSDILGLVTSLESSISSETRRIMDAEARARDAVSRTVSSVKQEVEVLQSQVAVQQKQREKDQKHAVEGAVDQDARAILKALEDQVGSMESGVKEALELGKKAITAASAAQPASGPGAAWWNKLGTGSGSKSVLQIKSADGQDVSGLITHLVDSAVSRISKDGIAKPDFALYSGGARVIPSLTSPAMELRPRGLTSKITGLFTGKGYFEFAPPTWALHHDVQAGHCWPFAGSEGQLGVRLVAPTIIDEVTIDHVAKEIAYDMSSAPKSMDVWGFVDGADNVARVETWKAERVARKDAGEQGLEDEAPYPPTLPENFIRLANFTYDIDAPNNVQTFPVDPEIRNLSVDFGIVVLRVLDNWGRSEFTCLYRFRVHGTPIGVTGLSFSEDGSEQP